MTSEEKVAARKISRIMRAARKQLGLNQETVSSRLGISQSALSKLEHGTLIPSAPQWFTFCRMTGISTDSFVVGYIERNQLASLQKGDREGTFRLPRKYAQFRGTKVRSTLPFLNYLEAALGEKKMREQLKAMKVDPDFFIDLDNQISIDFSLDVARFLYQQKLLKPSEIQKLVKPINRPELHGSLHNRYSGSKDPAALLTALILNSRYYDCNFIYRIEEHSKQSFDFSWEPERHMSEISWKDDPILGDFVCRYQKAYFERFLAMGEGENGRQVLLKELECVHRGSQKCVYRLDLNT